MGYGGGKGGRLLAKLQTAGVATIEATEAAASVKNQECRLSKLKFWHPVTQCAYYYVGLIISWYLSLAGNGLTHNFFENIVIKLSLL